MCVCSKRRNIQSPRVEWGTICVSYKRIMKKVIFCMLFLGLVLSEDLPRKYMALRGYDISGNDIKQVSASVCDEKMDLY